MLQELKAKAFDINNQRMILAQQDKELAMQYNETVKQIDEEMKKIEAEKKSKLQVVKGEKE